jgi:uncharacterized protein YbjT (DUF2867 family)
MPVRPEPVEGHFGRFDKLTANGLIFQVTRVTEQQLYYKPRNCHEWAFTRHDAARVSDSCLSAIPVVSKGENNIMICITGASGTVSTELINELASAQAPFRAAYFSNTKADTARTNGIDAVVMDYNRPETLRSAFQGCDSLFLLGPNALNQTQLELNAVEAAKAVGVRHIVKQSVMGAVDEAFSLALVHRPVEQAIASSGMAWTFLRPNSFMQNVVTFMSGTIKAESALYSASGEAKISHVDVRDIAAVAVKALTEPTHTGKAYTLTGPEALTYDELADELSTVLGRPIRHISLSPSDLKHGMLAEGLPEALADRMLDLERYFREGQASRITHDITQVTRRNPRRFAQYARDYASFL